MRRRIFLAAWGGLVAIGLIALGVRASLHTRPPPVELPDTASGIHLAMLFNNNERNKAVESGKIDYVWGADSGWAMNDEPAQGVQHGWYSLFTMDEHDNSNHDLAWFGANHPDWIEYRCDRTTALYGRSFVEYDITNPAVQAYELHYIEEAMAGGYNGVDFDLTDTFNYNHACGHFDARGVWVQQYSGNILDPAYRQAIITAFQQVAAQIRRAAATRDIAFSIAINCSFDLDQPLAQTEDLFPYVDLVLDEDGFTRGGYASTNRLTADTSTYSNDEWLTKMSWYRDLLNQGKGLIINAEEPYRVTASNPPPVSDVNWVLANYLLIKNDATFQGLITGNQQYGGPYLPLPAYSVPIGTPTGMMEEQQGIWLRDYSDGIALVNPSPTVSVTVTLPAGRYTDLTGSVVGPTVTLPAGGSGLVLLRSD